MLLHVLGKDKGGPSRTTFTRTTFVLRQILHNTINYDARGPRAAHKARWRAAMAEMSHADVLSFFVVPQPPLIV